LPLRWRRRGGSGHRRRRSRPRPSTPPPPARRSAAREAPPPPATAAHPAAPALSAASGARAPPAPAPAPAWSRSTPPARGRGRPAWSAVRGRPSSTGSARTPSGGASTTSTTTPRARRTSERHRDDRALARAVRELVGELPPAQGARGDERDYGAETHIADVNAGSGAKRRRRRARSPWRSRGEPEDQAPGRHGLAREEAADVEQLHHDIEDRARGEREEEHRDPRSTSTLADDGAEEGRRPADHAQEGQEAPTRLVASPESGATMPKPSVAFVQAGSRSRARRQG